MPITKLTGREILDGSVSKQDLNIADTGKAVVTQILGGDNIDLDWTGPVADEGTGVVTVNVTGLLFTAPPGAGLHTTIRKDGGHTMGVGCNYSSLLSGKSNTITDGAKYSTIVGGKDCIVQSLYGAVVGGEYNEITTASGYYGATASFIGGGRTNSIYDSTLSIIVGGTFNTIDDTATSFIGGGSGNIISNQWAVICGGTSNFNDGNLASIVGGYNGRIANSAFSFIGGGFYNEIDPSPVPSMSHGFIGTGYRNEVKSSYSSIINGKNCSTLDDYNTIVGGDNVNIGVGKFNLAGSVKNSAITGEYSAVLSGQGNSAAGYTSHSVIVGGNANMIMGGLHVAIINGYNNAATDSSYATIINGHMNETESGHATILGGEYNFIDRDSAHSLIWGTYNTVNPDCPHSFVHGDNVLATNHAQKSWSSGRFTDEWTAQVSDFILRRCTGPGDSENLPMFLDWVGDRKSGEAGSGGSREVSIGEEYGTYFVECTVSAFFTFTGTTTPYPLNKHACFYRNFMITWNGTAHLIDGSTRFNPMPLTRQTGGNTELECFFITSAGGVLRLMVNHIDKFQTAYWLGHMRVTHLSIRA